MGTRIETTEQLAKLLADRRKSLKLSQSDVANFTNLSVNGISKFESSSGEREVKLSTLFKLSPILGFKISLEFEE